MAGLTVVPAAAQMISAGAVRDAWYQAPLAADLEPLCAAPTGCSPAGAAYADGTLHVGNLNGGTTEFSVVAFDTAALPPFAVLTGGTAVFPLLDASGGSIAEDNAVLTACLLTASFEEVDGAPVGEAPAYDCAVRAPAVVDVDAGHVLVDLTRFVDAWVDGPFGLALLPDSADAGSWHVALAGREADDGPRAELLWQSPADDAGASPDGSAGAPTAPPSDDPVPASTGSPPAVSGGVPPAAPPPGPIGAAPTGPVVAEPGDTDNEEGSTEQPIVTAAEPVPVPYPYKVAWLLPLVVLVASASMTRSLRQDVLVIPADAPRGLRARLWFALWPEE